METAHLLEQQIRSEEIYDGRILHVTRDTVLLENGDHAIREVVHHPGGACAVPVVMRDGVPYVLMVKQFRYPHRAETLELPAGKLEYGEDPSQCAVRELREEAGAVLGEDAKFTSLGALFPTPAYDTEVIYMYLAQQITLLHEQSLDEDEFLDVTELPLSEAVEMVMRDEIRDAKTQIALLKAARILGL